MNALLGFLFEGLSIGYRASLPDGTVVRAFTKRTAVHQAAAAMHAYADREVKQVGFVKAFDVLFYRLRPWGNSDSGLLLKFKPHNKEQRYATRNPER